MRRIAFILAVAIGLALPQSAEAQTWEFSASAFTQNNGEGKDRSNGYGLSATHVFEKAHDNIHFVGSGTVHHHIDKSGDPSNNIDAIYGGGVRLTTRGVWVQATGNVVHQETDGDDPKISTKFGPEYAAGYTFRDNIGFQITSDKIGFDGTLRGSLYLRF